MKRIFTVIAVIVIAAFANSSAQVQLYGRWTEKGTIEPDINMFGTIKIKDSCAWRITYFALVEKTWGEAYVGLAYTPKSWLSMGLSAGIEQNKPLYRTGGYVWLGDTAISFLLALEKGDGKDNYWYKADLSYKCSPEVAFGIVIWRFHGFGPIVKYTIPNSPIKLWLMAGNDLEQKNAHRVMFGLDIQLE